MASYERYFDAEGFGVGVMRGTGPAREWNRADLGGGRDVVVLATDGRLHAFETPGYEFSSSERRLFAG